MKVSLSWVAVGVSLAVVQQVAAAPFESSLHGDANDLPEARQVFASNADGEYP